MEIQKYKLSVRTNSMTFKQFIFGCIKNWDLPLAFTIMVACTLSIPFVNNWGLIPLFGTNFYAGYYLGKNL